MRVLAAADIHGHPEVYDWLVGQAHEHQVGALILAGDLLGFREGFEAPEDAQRHEAEDLVRQLDSSGALVLYVMGNDDLVDLEPRSQRVQSLHGRRVEHGGLAFIGGVFERSEAAIAADQCGVCRAAACPPDRSANDAAPGSGHRVGGSGQVVRCPP